MLILSQRILPSLRTTTRKASAIPKPATMSTSTYKINALPRSLYPVPISYQPADFKRMDERLDTQWYSQPRFVQHIDDGAIAALKTYYENIIKPTSSVLDVCSSWVSHLPDTLRPQSMVGYGMNKEEMARNGHLTSYFVKDLNSTPSLKEVPDSSVDVAICNVSVDYLTQPVSVFKEMHRVLKTGGTAHMAFSNRCFPTKVIGKWMGMSDAERRQWVGGYFWASEGWSNVEEVVLKEGKSGWMAQEDPLFVVRARKV